MKSFKLRQATILLALWPLMTAMSPSECESIETRHAELLAGSFEVLREFRMSINGELKKRELVRVSFDNGAFETEILEEETYSKMLVLDGGGGDPALSIPFDCARLEQLEDEVDGYRLTSEDGLEWVVFRRHEPTDTLAPTEWRLETVERFLFKKLEIRGEASYSDFRARPRP